jgi:hypothetical protein
MNEIISRRTLPCGCRVGDYKTSRGATVIIVDAVAPECHASSHRLNAVLSMIGVVADDDADTETAA